MATEKSRLLSDEEEAAVANAGPRRLVREGESGRWAFFLALSLMAVTMLSYWVVGTTSAPTPTSPEASGDFNTYKHMGHLSPFHVPHNMPASLRSGAPPGCTASRAFLVHRHGSRHPHDDELAVIRDLADYLEENREMFSRPEAELPAAWSFLQEGWDARDFVVDDLTAPGRQQLFDHGVGLRLALPDLSVGAGATVADEDRVIESARWFLEGYHGRNRSGAADDGLDIIPEDEDTVSWLTPHKTCAAWDEGLGSAPAETWGRVYLPPIAERVNGALGAAYPRGANFTAAHVHGMFWACAYGTAVLGAGAAPWCAVFSPAEFRANEYEYDLLQRGFSSYGLPGDIGPVLGGLLVSNVTAFLTREGGDTQRLSLNFGHDKTLAFGLTALGLARDDEFPEKGPFDRHRRWRSAKLVPFASYMLWKRLECGSGSGEEAESRIQLVLNGANYGLEPTGCEIDRYGTCALDDFLGTDKVRAALNVSHGDARWKAACEE